MRMVSITRQMLAVDESSRVERHHTGRDRDTKSRLSNGCQCPTLAGIFWRFTISRGETTMGQVSCPAPAISKKKLHSRFPAARTCSQALAVGQHVRQRRPHLQADCGLASAALHTQPYLAYASMQEHIHVQLDQSSTSSASSRILVYRSLVRCLLRSSTLRRYWISLFNSLSCYI